MVPAASSGGISRAPDPGAPGRARCSCRLRGAAVPGLCSGEPGSAPAGKAERIRPWSPGSQARPLWQRLPRCPPQEVLVWQSGRWSLSSAEPSSSPPATSFPAVRPRPSSIQGKDVSAGVWPRWKGASAPSSLRKSRCEGAGLLLHTERGGAGRSPGTGPWLACL